jgi:hypothetical protein
MREAHGLLLLALLTSLAMAKFIAEMRACPI